MTDISADPQKGLDAAIQAVPDLAADRTGQMAVLQATIDMWHDPLTDAQGLGAIDRAGWTASIAFMSKLPGGLVPNPVTVGRDRGRQPPAGALAALPARVPGPAAPVQPGGVPRPASAGRVVDRGRSVE